MKTAKIGARTGHGSYHVTRFSEEHGMDISIGMVYPGTKAGEHWVAYFGEDQRASGFPNRKAAVEAVDAIDRIKQGA